MFEKHLNEILNILRCKTNAEIAICTIPWIGERRDAKIMPIVRNFNSVIKRTAEKYHLRIIDIFEA